MTRSLILLLFMCCMRFIAAQDIIYRVDRTEIEAVILELSEKRVKYRDYRHPDGPTISISLSEVFMIIYEDGRRLLIERDTIPIQQDVPEQMDQYPTGIQEPSLNVPVVIPDNVNLIHRDPCFKGIQDASIHYKGYRAAAGATLATSFFLGILGLVPAIATSSVKPSKRSLNMPDSPLSDNMRYYNCYLKEARQTKVNKIWTMFGIGIGVNLMIFLIIFLSTI